MPVDVMKIENLKGINMPDFCGVNENKTYFKTEFGLLSK